MFEIIFGCCLIGILITILIADVFVIISFIKGDWEIK